MALLYAIGEGLVMRDELVEKAATGAATAFVDALAHHPDRARLELSTGVATAANVLTAFGRGAGGEPVGHEPIGLGKPLTIEIRHVYPGKYPRQVLIGGANDMLVTSAMKGIEVYDGAPRAVNFLEQNVKPHKPLRLNDPKQPGTPLIFYSPAVTRLNSVLAVEMAFQEFPSGVIDALKGAVRSAAGLPIFAPASAHLYAAGELLNLVGVVGRAVFDSKGEFDERTPVTFDRPGDYPTVADFRVLMEDKHADELRDAYHVSPRGELVDGGGRAYAGDHPYVVLSFDGRPRDEYRDFAPMAAGADLLERFFGGGKAVHVGLDVLTRLMRFHSDWEFRREALGLDKRLRSLDAGDPHYGEKKAQLTVIRDAAVCNIQEEDLKPKFT